MEKFNVIVLSYVDDKYKEVITSRPVSKHIAMQVESGANINLNHDMYYTELEPAMGE